MIEEAVVPEFSTQNWQRINMRTVSHLIGAEVIHDLYSRHWPRINSIRFRHTITSFHDGIVHSYAPKPEWVMLQKWLAKRFAKRARMQRLMDEYGKDEEFTNSRLMDEDSNMKEELSQMKVRKQ